MQTIKNQMTKVATSNGYDYYYGSDNGNKFYNIVPSGQAAPNGGYSRAYICAVKNMPDLFPKALNSVKVLFADSTCNYETSVSAHTTEKEATEYFVGKSFDMGHFPAEEIHKCIGIEFINNNL